MKGLHLIAIVSLLGLLSSCDESVKEYYYSLEDFTVPKFYKYENKTNPSYTQYWKMSSKPDDQILITEAFNADFVQFEYFSEQYDSEGSKLVEYYPISEGQKTGTTPIHKDVFLWQPKDEYQYQVEYTDKNGKTTFSKKRKLISFEDIEYMGIKTQAAKFRGDYSFQYHKYGQTVEYWQYSYYTKEHGFVKYNRTLPDGSKSTLELTEILSESDWQQLTQ
ncbi:hypothetical protein K6119_10645 [Paracrocinitomix mangrovi]|uniref:hypothetical protein n=1 Tax=Paracrocinitomix mangrovi TaxID=2862509 RepID=UPI001ED9D4A7|nr:hypothetical protein [Paracrocinitomix mangrovi]UKN00190.1 hypothetical protein K6119_10645 [Paracrocinitomix mangrovi]